MGIHQNLFTSDAVTKRLRWLSVVETISFVVIGPILVLEKLRRR